MQRKDLPYLVTSYCSEYTDSRNFGKVYFNLTPSYILSKYYILLYDISYEFYIKDFTIRYYKGPTITISRTKDLIDGVNKI